MVLTEKEMDRAAQAWIEMLIDDCKKYRQAYKIVGKEMIPLEPGTIAGEIGETIVQADGQCDCVTESLNMMMPLIPKGEKAQTRKTFMKMVDKLKKMKKTGELTNCTQQLKI